MEQVIKPAGRIFEWMCKHRRPVSQLLLPGIAPREVARLEAILGWQIPREAAQLFRWRNGVAQDSRIALDDLYFFPWFYLLSLEEAIEEVKIRTNTGEFRSRLLPIFANGAGDFKLMDCARTRGDSAPILAFQHGEPDQFEEYSSLTSMMEILAECFEQGAFYLKDGFLEIDDDRQASIARELDPRVEYWWR